MTETTTIPSRIAALADDSQLVHGIAISAGEVTRGLNGRKQWPADALRAAAASLEGTPVNPLHSESEVGTVRRAAYDESREAIVYELELDDAKLAEQVRSGGLEVSIEARHGSDGTTDDGAMLVSSITFTGIALVQHGASRSASAEHGPAPEQAFAAALSAGQIQSALAEHNGGSNGDSNGEMDMEMDVPEEYVFDNPGEAVAAAEDLGWTDGPGDERIHTHEDGDDTVFMPGPSHEALVDRLQERGELAAAPDDGDAEAATLREVAGVEFDSVGDGKLDESAIPSEGYAGHYLYPGDTKSESTYAVVDADGTLRRGNVESAHSLGCRGRCDDAEAHDRRLRALAQEFDSVPEWATEEAEAADGELGFPANVFEVRPAKGEESNYDSSLLGIGVQFPNSGAYVDWRTESFPDELEHPHVSIYGSVTDLEKATGNRVEMVAHTESELAARTSDEFRSALTSVSEAAKHKYEAEAEADVSQGDIVVWNSQGERPAAGRVIETIDEGRYDTELSGDATVNAPAALIRLYRPSGDGEWSQTDVTVAHRTDTETLTVVEEWPEVARMQAAHLVDINGTEIDISPPDYVVAAAEAALEAKEEYDELADCGTGVGEARARAIVNNDLAPSDFTGGENTAIPDYLNSHEEDVNGIDSPPGEWDEETWTDGCGPVQYALWGGTADGRALEWFSDKEAELETAMDEASAAGGTPGVLRGYADVLKAQQSDEAAESAMGARGGSTPQPDSVDSMSDTNNPDDPDEPSVEELRARLSKQTDSIDELEAELSTVKEERDELKDKAEAVDEAKAAFAAALADHVPRDAEALEADLSLTQMREWVADIEEASVGDAALSDTDPEPDVQSGGGDAETAELSGAALKEKQELESQIEEQEARLAKVNEGSMAHSLAQREKERLESEIEELEA